MGKGDKKSRRGKIFQGSFGVRRRRKKANKPTVVLKPIVREKQLSDKKPLKDKKAVKETDEIP